MALLLETPGVVAVPFMALTTPPVVPGRVDGVLLIPTVVPLVMIVPVGGGVPGTVEDEERGFWSRDTSPIGSIVPTVDGVMLPVP